MQKELSNGWEHYQLRGDVETVKVSDRSGAIFDARIWEEIVSTGKQRVHMGYRNVLESGIRNFCSGRHSTRIVALRDLAQQMEAHGYTLHVCGLDPLYYATGLSEDSGHGYMRRGGSGRDRPVRLISPIEPASS